MHFRSWYILMYFFMYRLSIQRALADGRFQINLQLWEPPDFRPTSICCPANRTVPSSDSFDLRPNISVTSDTCMANCDLYSEFCLGTHQIAQQFDATRDCMIGRNISRLNHSFAWRNSSLSDIEFLIQGRLPPFVTIILQIFRSDNPLQPSNSWTPLARTVFREAQPVASEQWTTLRRVFGSVTPVSTSNETTDVVHSVSVTPHLILNYRFQCEQNFYGPDCDRFCQPMRGPHGNFICDPDTGRQQCLPGWSGERCTEAICDPPCLFGSCVRPNYCKCRNGWQGKDCGQCQVYPGCVHGECERNKTDASMIPLTCECHGGWGGMLCDIDLQYCQRHSQVCQNGGLCVNTRNRGESFHRCVCSPQFYGRHCEQRVTGCEVDGCGAFGTCVQASNNTYVCQCQAGHCGSSCQFTGSVACGEPIDVHSTEEPLNQTTISTNEQPSKCPDAPCLNGGVCETSVCHCPIGFHGTFCHLRLTNQTADDSDVYLDSVIHDASNETHAVSLESATFLSSLYRSSILLFLLAFILLLLTAVFVHCIHSHLNHHHRHQKPRYVHPALLSYPHIANNLATTTCTSPNSVDHNGRKQSKGDSWTIQTSCDPTTTKNSNTWLPPKFAFDSSPTEDKWTLIHQHPVKLSLDEALLSGQPKTYVFPISPTRTMASQPGGRSWSVPHTKSSMSATHIYK